jgi:hypothetical protein
MMSSLYAIIASVAIRSLEAARDAFPPLQSPQSARTVATMLLYF